MVAGWNCHCTALAQTVSDYSPPPDDNDLRKKIQGICYDEIGKKIRHLDDIGCNIVVFLGPNEKLPK